VTVEVEAVFVVFVAAAVVVVRVVIFFADVVDMMNPRIKFRK
jgi:hypothetical protein